MVWWECMNRELRGLSFALHQIAVPLRTWTLCNRTAHILTGLGTDTVFLSLCAASISSAWHAQQPEVDFTHSMRSVVIGLAFSFPAWGSSRTCWNLKCESGASASFTNSGLHSKGLIFEGNQKCSLYFFPCLSPDWELCYFMHSSPEDRYLANFSFSKLKVCWKLCICSLCSRCGHLNFCWWFLKDRRFCNSNDDKSWVTYFGEEHI